MMPSFDELKKYEAADVAQNLREHPDLTLCEFLMQVEFMVEAGSFPREVFYEVSQVSKLLRKLKEDRIKGHVAN
jgi:transposase